MIFCNCQRAQVACAFLFLTLVSGCMMEMQPGDTDGEPTGSTGEDTSGPEETTIGLPDGCEPLPAHVELADIGDSVPGFQLVADYNLEAFDGGLLGFAISDAGDVNGDGLDDVLIGASLAYEQKEYSGRAYVVFGKDNLEPVLMEDVEAGIGGFSIRGTAESDRVGASLRGIGDVNGDGLDDVIIGNDISDPMRRVHVVFGKQDTQPVYRSEIEQGIGGFAVVAGDSEEQPVLRPSTGHGDVNGDGFADILVANAYPFIDSKGKLFVVFGKANNNGVMISDIEQGNGGFAIIGQELEFLGGDFAVVEDINGDGLDDIAITMPFLRPTRNDNETTQSRIYIVFGKDNTNPVTTLDLENGIGGFVIYDQDLGAKTSASSSLQVSSAGDFNGDGLGDIVVGQFDYPRIPLTIGGRAYLVLGKDDPSPIFLEDVSQNMGGFAFDGASYGVGGEYLGVAVGGGEDFNHDGYDDVIVGSMAWVKEGEIDESGRAYLLFGNADATPRSREDLEQGNGGFVLDGAWPGSNAGSAVDMADANGDGFSDLLIGAPTAPMGNDPDLMDPEISYVVFGGCE